MIGDGPFAWRPFGALKTAADGAMQVRGMQLAATPAS